jgi:hypothetical protein
MAKQEHLRDVLGAVANAVAALIANDDERTAPRVQDELHAADELAFPLPYEQPFLDDLAHASTRRRAATLLSWLQSVSDRLRLDHAEELHAHVLFERMANSECDSGIGRPVSARTARLLWLACATLALKARGATLETSQVCYQLCLGGSNGAKAKMNDMVHMTELTQQLEQIEAIVMAHTGGAVEASTAELAAAYLSLASGAAVDGLTGHGRGASLGRVSHLDYSHPTR